MKYYRITQVEECSICHGIGLIEEPAWGRFNKTFTHRDLEDLFAWGKEKGYNTDSYQELTRLWFSEQGYSSVPPEEVSCYHCHGKGETTEEVSLEDALKDLGVL